MPMTLCQLKSRALLVPYARLKKATAATLARFHTRGSQRYMPDMTRNRNSMFDQPVAARAVGREAPSTDSQRCQLRMAAMNQRTPPGFGAPRTRPL